MPCLRRSDRRQVGDSLLKQAWPHNCNLGGHEEEEGTVLELYMPQSKAQNGVEHSGSEVGRVFYFIFLLVLVHDDDVSEGKEKV